MADRRKEDTKMYQKRGLVYTALDDNGNKFGTPIKASDFYSKPTLKYLEQKFVQNEALRQVQQQRLKVATKWVLVKEKQTLCDFTKALAREGTLNGEQKQWQEQNHDKDSSQKQGNVLELVMKPERLDSYMPYQLLNKKRKQSKG